jgi:hypothetical protein
VLQPAPSTAIRRRGQKESTWLPSRSAAYLSLHDSAQEGGGVLARGFLDVEAIYWERVAVVVAVADRQSVPLLPPPQLAGPCGSLKRSAMITFGYEQ